MNVMRVAVIIFLAVISTERFSFQIRAERKYDFMLRCLLCLSYFNQNCIA
jgi:hypothetical protein